MAVALTVAQVALLDSLVEAASAEDENSRQSFMRVGHMNGQFIKHPHFDANATVHQGDLLALEDAGFILIVARSKNDYTFDVTRKGLDYIADAWLAGADAQASTTVDLMPKLEASQEALLARLAEAARSQAPTATDSFMWTSGFGGDVISHPQTGDFGDFKPSDLKMLERARLIYSHNRSKHFAEFDVTPEGFERWEAMKRAQGGPTKRIESEVRTFLDSAQFRKTYEAAWSKWQLAEELLWSAQPAEASAIGHHCREAMQLFARDLCSNVGVEAPGNLEQTVVRARAALTKLTKLSPTRTAMLHALLVYWGTVTDLTQRQEHGASKEGEPIGWEDGRIVVFHTALVMFELARASG